MDLQFRNVANNLACLLNEIKNNSAVRLRFKLTFRELSKEDKRKVLNLLNEVKAIAEDEY